MAATVETLRRYLRLPSNDTEDLTGYLAAAQSKARTAGISAFAHNAQYDMFLHSLAAMYYDNRGMEPDNPASAAAMERMISSFVLELRYADEDPEGGEGG
jgi:hypothetical protein